MKVATGMLGETIKGVSFSELSKIAINYEVSTAVARKKYCHFQEWIVGIPLISVLKPIRPYKDSSCRRRILLQWAEIGAMT